MANCITRLSLSRKSSLCVTHLNLAFRKLFTNSILFSNFFHDKLKTTGDFKHCNYRMPMVKVMLMKLKRLLKPEKRNSRKAETLILQTHCYSASHICPSPIYSASAAMFLFQMTVWRVNRLWADNKIEALKWIWRVKLNFFCFCLWNYSISHFHLIYFGTLPVRVNPFRHSFIRATFITYRIAPKTEQIMFADRLHRFEGREMVSV